MGYYFLGVSTVLRRGEASTQQDQTQESHDCVNTAKITVSNRCHEEAVLPFVQDFFVPPNSVDHEQVVQSIDRLAFLHQRGWLEVGFFIFWCRVKRCYSRQKRERNGLQTVYRGRGRARHISFNLSLRGNFVGKGDRRFHRIQFTHS